MKYYAGTDMPADYASYVRIGEKGSGNSPESVGGENGSRRSTVSMNSILVCQGYRFCQTSYGQDKRGSLFSVNHDPWGIGLTYSGYALLGLSVVLVLMSRRGGFRRLLRHPMLRKGGMAGVFLLLAVPSV